ncbi:MULTISPECIES: rhodanese-like domain-containing protein [unclassified Spirosoma]|uniref:rhodanese-like domain-containing protein n=1 Tax=unclassified Spirosoma TaxID=2621999 RepID=UPI000A67487B|nr:MULTISPECIES: rhodanese-like domain-containing protein [unclassified Spirosoma]
MKNRVLLLFSLILFVSVSLSAQTLTFDAFEAKLHQAGSRAQILDARSEEEYTQNHLNGAVSFSVADQADFARKIQKLDKSAPVFIYSIANGRSGQLAKQLREAGFADVTEIPGGLSKWIGLGRPVESTVGSGLSLTDYQASLT